MYDWRPFVIDTLMSPGNDYWAASFAGHGVNSYSVNFFVVQGSITLLLQEGWDGIYMEASKQRSIIEKEFSACSQLLEQTQASLRLTQDEGRLVIAASGFRGSSWGWLDAPAVDFDSAEQWLRANSAPAADPANALATLRLASEWLDGR